jgi:transposase
MAEYAAYIGIDWSDKKHDCCLVDAATGKKEFSIIKQTRQAIQEWATNLQKRFGGRTLAVAVKQSRGPLIFALLKYDFLVLYPINPSTLARYREAFSPSRAKDDPTDAEYAVELLMHHRDRLKAWMPDDNKTRTLQYLVEHRRRVVSDRTRISNRMTALLKLYFLQVLEWFPDIRTCLVCDFLLKWPTLEEVKKARRVSVEKFFREHNSARKQAMAERLKAIKESLPLTEDEAVISSFASS